MTTYAIFPSYNEIYKVSSKIIENKFLKDAKDNIKYQSNNKRRLHGLPLKRKKSNNLNCHQIWGKDNKIFIEETMFNIGMEIYKQRLLYGTFIR